MLTGGTTWEFDPWPTENQLEFPMGTRTHWIPGALIVARSASREVRISCTNLFQDVHFSRGTLPPKKGEKGHY